MARLQEDREERERDVHFGGLVGYSSGKVTSSLNRPPSQIVFSLPGTPQSHFFRSMTPLAPRIGFAKKPNGWSRLHCFLRYL